MKKRLRFTGIFTALTLSVVFSTTYSAPRLSLRETSFDFGYVPQNSAICHKFWLVSTGDDTLKILNVIPGCGCTKTPLKKNELAAGDSTELEVIFSTKSYRNSVAKNPTIQTNEGPPDRHVRIVSNVIQNFDSTYPLILSPYKLDLSQNSEKTIDKMEFTIKNISDSELDIKLVSSDRDFFEISLPKLVEPGKTAKGKVILKDTVLNDSFEKSFTIEVNDQSNSRFTLPIKRSVAKTRTQHGSAR